MAESSLGFAIEAKGLVHRYSGVLALDDLSIAFERGSFSAVLGSNGAGKSTLAQLLSGMLKPTAGTIRYGGLDEASVKLGRGLIRSGVCLVPEGRRLFGQLSIEENLVLGGYGAGLGRVQIRQRMQEVLEMLPAGLREGMRTRLAGMLSGGERQMLALARALMAKPSIIIIDEPSMGLAPLLIQKVYDILSDLHRRGVTIVVVEQQATHALLSAQTVHVMERGRLIYSGPPSSSEVEAALRSGYVGGAS
ncbi:MAG: ATP-binding cassette domain-containing protein [Betaproteobacteria bacterium]